MRKNRQILKRWVERLQTQQAKLDVQLGRPPAKSSKTYINAYANEYAHQEGLAYYDFAPF